MNIQELNEHRFDLIDEPCPDERHELRELLEAGKIAEISERIAGSDFVECSNRTKGSHSGQFIVFSAVEKLLGELGALIQRLTQSEHELRQRLDASALANSQLAGAVAMRDREIEEVRRELAVEKAIASRSAKA